MKIRGFSERAIAAACLICALMASAYSDPRTAPQQKPKEETFTVEMSGQRLFDFHSGFWMNLHHFLYQQASWIGATSSVQQRRIPSGGQAKLDGLSQADLAAWSEAVEYYRKEMIGLDLLTDPAMQSIKETLSNQEVRDSLDGAPSISAPLLAILRKAAPVYKANWWPQHNEANRRWIEALTQLVEKHGPALSRDLAAAYKTEWPSSPVRVDVSIAANWSGGYTTIRPTHITISSGDVHNQGYSGLEILFHEASHGLVGRVFTGIAAAAKKLNKPAPPGLWHAVLFFTTGEIVRRELAKAGVPGYTPYAYAHGLYDGGFREYRKALEEEWKPYLDGKLDFDTALSKTVAAVGAP